MSLTSPECRACAASMCKLRKLQRSPRPRLEWQQTPRAMLPCPPRAELVLTAAYKPCQRAHRSQSGDV
eukprot:13301476-Alexandrium_andersonii.AAC.1